MTNSGKSLVTVAEALKMLRLYIVMERLRFDNTFDDTITYTHAVGVETLMVPPLLLQPFCENAIWHGFMNLPDRQTGKDGGAPIHISIRTEDDLFECVITDNGIGRKKAAEFKSRSARKERSLGLNITRERLLLFGEENNTEANFEMEDLADENGNSTGTRVILRIADKKAIEKPA